MADKTGAEEISSAMDYKAHEATYRGFLNLTKWTVGIIALVLIVLYFVVKP
jgi:hypothetical protein